MMANSVISQKPAQRKNRSMGENSPNMVILLPGPKLNFLVLSFSAENIHHHLTLRSAFAKHSIRLRRYVTRQIKICPG
jgi:hypothetical protein